MSGSKSKSVALTLRMIALGGLLCLLYTPLSWSYGEDITTPNTDPHSTFHYAFTRTLARAAGFTVDQAELIAVADQATDSGTFKGDSTQSPRVQIDGTQRVSPAGLYYHFARRPSQNATGEYAYPGARDTCSYFIGTADRCRGQAELTELELWAVYGRGTPMLGVPPAAVNGAALRSVPAPSLLSLAIYLHALADSYSHEACMKEAQFRGHKPHPPACTSVYWHEEAEFGRDPSQDVGTPYTKEAGLATWRALKWFRRVNQLAGTALWSDETARAFIKTWVELDKPGPRRDFALRVYETLK
jgi:hypothetical protein